MNGFFWQSVENKVSKEVFFLSSRRFSLLLRLVRIFYGYYFYGTCYKLLLGEHKYYFVNIFNSLVSVSIVVCTGSVILSISHFSVFLIILSNQLNSQKATLVYQEPQVFQTQCALQISVQKLSYQMEKHLNLLSMPHPARLFKNYLPADL